MPLMPLDTASCFVVQPPSLCQKRKIEFDASGTLDEDMESNGNTQPWMGNLTAPKRQCLWSSHESQHWLNQSHHEDSLPGCLKDPHDAHGVLPPAHPQVLQAIPEVPSPISPATEQIQVRSSNNLANLFISRLQQRQREEQERQLSAQAEQSQDGEMTMEEDEQNNNDIKNCLTNDDGMESDFVPDMNQYSSQQQAAATPSTPQTIRSTSDRRCGFNACGGLRPSPVTGRLHCLCSASWRGMYGMDSMYMNDYY